MPETTDIAQEKRKRQDLFFGKLVVDKGLATREQVSECLGLQATNLRKGKYFRLAIIMVKKKYLSPADAKSILKAQDTAIVECASCLKKYNILNYEEGQTYLCKHCGGTLKRCEIGQQEDLAVDGTLDADTDDIKAPGDDATRVDLPRMPVPQPADIALVADAADIEEPLEEPFGQPLEEEAPGGLVISENDLDEDNEDQDDAGGEHDDRPLHDELIEPPTADVVVGDAEIDDDTSDEEPEDGEDGVPVLLDQDRPDEAASRFPTREDEEEDEEELDDEEDEDDLDDDDDIEYEPSERNEGPVIEERAALSQPPDSAGGRVEDKGVDAAEDDIEIEEESFSPEDEDRAAPPVPSAGRAAPPGGFPVGHEELDGLHPAPPPLPGSGPPDVPADNDMFQEVEYITTEGEAVRTPPTRLPEPPAPDTEALTPADPDEIPPPALGDDDEPEVDEDTTVDEESEEPVADEETLADGFESMEEGEWSPQDLVGYRIGGATIEEYRYSQGICHEYMARHELLDDPEVCLAVIPNTHASERFFRDVSRAARELVGVRDQRLQRLLDYGDDHGYFYLVKSRPVGERLDEYVGRLGGLDDDVALLLVRELFKALRAIHDAGVFAQHLPAQNITVTRDARLVLNDFQVSEQPVRDEDTGIRRDMVSAGRLWHYLLTARANIPTSPEELQRRLREENASARTTDVLTRLLFPEENPFHDIADLLDALDAADQQLVVEMVSSPREEDEPPRSPEPEPPTLRESKTPPPIPDKPLEIPVSEPAAPETANAVAGGGPPASPAAAQPPERANGVVGLFAGSFGGVALFALIVLVLVILAAVASNTRPGEDKSPPGPGARKNHVPRREDNLLREVDALRESLAGAGTPAEFRRVRDLAAAIAKGADSRAKVHPLATLRVNVGYERVPVRVLDHNGEVIEGGLGDSDIQGEFVIEDIPVSDFPFQVEVGRDKRFVAANREILLDGSKRVINLALPARTHPDFYRFPLMPGRAPGDGIEQLERLLGVKATRLARMYFFKVAGQTAVEVYLDDDDLVEKILVSCELSPPVQLFADISSDRDIEWVQLVLGTPSAHTAGSEPIWDVPLPGGGVVRFMRFTRQDRDRWSLRLDR